MSMRRVTVWAAVALIVVAACDRAPDAVTPESADTPPPQGGEPSAPQEGELLLASPPPRWEETNAVRSETLKSAEYGPPEDPDGRLERITFEAYGEAPLPDPIVFVEGVSRDLESRCQRFEDTNISSGLENGYPTSVRLMVCPRFKDSPRAQIVLTKAIQGNEQFYVITRRLQVPPMKEEGPPLTAQAMAEWTLHLKDIQVCDTRREAHPCPPSLGNEPPAQS